MSGPSASLRTRRRSDGGFTIIETMIAISIFSVVVAAALGLLGAFTAADHEQEIVGRARADLRSAMRDLERDLRSAGALTALSSASLATTQIDLVVPTAGGSTVSVRWRISADAGPLLRETLSGPSGSVTATRTELSATANSAAGLTFLRMFDNLGSELLPASATASDLATCTQRVRVALAVIASSELAPVTTTTDIDLASRNPNTGCATSAADPRGVRWTAAVASLSPLAWWKLDEAAGATTAVNSGSGSNLTLTWGSGASHGPGAIPSAGAAFSGSSGSTNLLTVANPTALDITPTGFTMVGWIEPQPGTTSSSGLVRRGSSTAGFYLRYLSGTLEASVGLSASSRVSAYAGSLPLNQWSFVAATASTATGTTTLTLYVNGLVVGTASAAGTITLASSGEGLVIGGRPTAFDEPLKGNADEIALWASALTDAQILDLYRAGT